MPDSLKRLIDAADRERARPHRIEPDRLVMAPRVAAKRRICLDCRMPLTLDSARSAWLAAHPLPKRFCPAGRWCSRQFKTRVKHRQWHEDQIVSLELPRLRNVVTCPLCGGRMVEVTI